MFGKFDITKSVGRLSKSSPASTPTLAPGAIAGILRSRLPAGQVNPGLAEQLAADIGKAASCPIHTYPGHIMLRRPGVPDTKGYAGDGTAAGANPTVGVAGTGFTVAAGAGQIATFLTNSVWGTQVNREFLQGDNHPKNLHVYYEDKYLVKVQAYVEVFASDAAGIIDTDTSEALTNLFRSQFALSVDSEGDSREYELAPTYLANLPEGGFELAKPVLWRDSSVVRFDYNGVQDLSRYPLMDHALGVPTNVSVNFVVIGFFQNNA